MNNALHNNSFKSPFLIWMAVATISLTTIPAGNCSILENHKPCAMQQLFYGENYLCFVGNECIGTATFTIDPYIGDSFKRMSVHKSRGLEEEILVPEWVLIMELDS